MQEVKHTRDTGHSCMHDKQTQGKWTQYFLESTNFTLITTIVQWILDELQLRMSTEFLSSTPLNKLFYTFTFQLQHSTHKFDVDVLRTFHRQPIKV